jgi:hypothetical protein
MKLYTQRAAGSGEHGLKTGKTGGDDFTGLLKVGRSNLKFEKN